MSDLEYLGWRRFHDTGEAYREWKFEKNAAKLGDVVQRVDQLVASALAIQKSLLMIYAEEEQGAEAGDAETEGESEGETEPAPAAPEY